MKKFQENHPASAEGFLLGVEAFKRGVKSAPALDSNVMPLIRKWNPAGTVGVGETINILQGWLNGWHMMHLRS